MTDTRTDSVHPQIILGPPFHRHWRGAAGFSIKAYGGGRVPFCVGRRLHFVDDDHYLVVNAAQEYEFSTPAQSSLFNFTIFLSAPEVADAWAAAHRREESLLEDPRTDDQPLPEFLVTPMSVTARLRAIRTELRAALLAGGLAPATKAAAAYETIAGAMSGQFQAMGQVRRVDAVRRTTREETVRRIRRAIEFIDADIARQLDLNVLAAVACMARYHFLRRFRDVTGETPHQFILRRRLARADELLVQTAWSAAEIGRACGFSEPSTFSSAFRAARGLPPLAWRRRQFEP